MDTPSNGGGDGVDREDGIGEASMKTMVDLGRITATRALSDPLPWVPRFALTWLRLPHSVSNMRSILRACALQLGVTTCVYRRRAYKVIGVLHHGEVFCPETITGNQKGDVEYSNLRAPLYYPGQWIFIEDLHSLIFI